MENEASGILISLIRSDRIHYWFQDNKLARCSLFAASPTSLRLADIVSSRIQPIWCQQSFDVWSSVNLAFGAEHRYENYPDFLVRRIRIVIMGRALVIGEDANGDDNLLPDVNGNVSTLFAANGKAYAGGAQAFPGFRPENAVNATRSSVAVYTDAELELFWFMVCLPVRFGLKITLILVQPSTGKLLCVIS